MKRFILVLFVAVSFIGCKKNSNEIVEVGFKASAHLLTELIESPKVQETVEFRLQLQNVPDGTYILTYSSDDKDSQISIGNYKDKKYQAGVPIEVIFYNGFATINYTALNAGVHKITFNVKTTEYTATAVIGQEFVPDLSANFLEFTKTNLLVDETVLCQLFSVRNDKDDSDDIFAKYEIIQGLECEPMLTTTNLSTLIWEHGQAKKVCSGRNGKTCDVEYSQKYAGTVIIRVTVFDKYGWEASKEYTMSAVSSVSKVLVSMSFEGNHFDSWNWNYVNNKGQNTPAYMEGLSELKMTISLTKDGQPYIATENVHVRVYNINYSLCKIYKYSPGGAPTQIIKSFVGRLSAQNPWATFAVYAGTSQTTFDFESQRHENNECVNIPSVRVICMWLDCMDESKYEAKRDNFTFTYPYNVAGQTKTVHVNFNDPSFGA